MAFLSIGAAAPTTLSVRNAMTTTKSIQFQNVVKYLQRSYNMLCRLVAKDWLIIGFNGKINQSGLVDRIFLGGEGYAALPPPAGYEGLRPSNSPWIGFQNPASINQSRLVEIGSYFEFVHGRPAGRRH